MNTTAKSAGGNLGEYAFVQEGSAEADRSTANVLKDIVGNVQEIIRSEVRLAKTEVREETRKVSAAGKLLAVGGVLGFYALGFIFLSLYLLLAFFVSVWIAALIVGVVLGGLAAILALKGRAKLKAITPKPEKTIESVKENAKWIKDQTRS
ncbi:MAG: phage holin family protein [Bryobacteraceae bacterium]